MDAARLMLLKAEEANLNKKECKYYTSTRQTQQQSDPKAEDWAAKILGLVMIQQ